MTSLIGSFIKEVSQTGYYSMFAYSWCLFWNISSKFIYQQVMQQEVGLHYNSKHHLLLV